MLALNRFLLFTDESRKELLLLLSSLSSSASSCIWDEAGEEAPRSSLGSCLTTISGASRVRMALQVVPAARRWIVGLVVRWGETTTPRVR